MNSRQKKKYKICLINNLTTIFPSNRVFIKPAFYMEKAINILAVKDT